MNRAVYLEKMLELQKNFSIKLITGFRGTGKTTLLKIFMDHLKFSGVSEEEIVFINFEETESLSNFQQLYMYVNEKIENLDHAYLLFDEIQLVAGWEKAVNAFFLGAPVEIYLTGSNENVLVNKIAPLLPDNFDIIRVSPLSFSEYAEISSKNVQVYENSDVANLAIFRDYLNFGGMPIVAEGTETKKIKERLVAGLYYEAIFKDIIRVYSLRDSDVFNAIMQFLALNIGQPIRPNAINDYLLESNRKTTSFTLENYLKLTDEIGLFKKIRRYDIKKDAFLNGAESFYCVDTGICNALLNFSRFDEMALMKNVIFTELWSRGYEIYCARLGKMTIDFLAVSANEEIYIQVLATDKKSSLGKLLRPLHKLPESANKLLISLKPVKLKGSVKNITITDFLLSK